MLVEGRYLSKLSQSSGGGGVLIVYLSCVLVLVMGVTRPSNYRCGVIFSDKCMSIHPNYPKG